MLKKCIIIIFAVIALAACGGQKNSDRTSGDADENINCGRSLCISDETIAKPSSICNDVNIPFAIQAPFQTSEFFDADKSFGLTMRFQLLGDGNGNDLSSGAIRAKILCFDKNALSKTTSFQYTMNFVINGSKVIITNPQEQIFNQEPTDTKVGCKVTIPQSQTEFQFQAVNSCLKLTAANETQLLVPTNIF